MQHQTAKVGLGNDVTWPTQIHECGCIACVACEALVKSLTAVRQIHFSRGSGYTRRNGVSWMPYAAALIVAIGLWQMGPTLAVPTMAFHNEAAGGVRAAEISPPWFA